MNVKVTVNKEAGTLTVSDRGIGMTSEDIDKYINQIAFSGAEEFLEKYKDNANAIIGHFGLGFYSAFMVAKKVEIISLSYKEGAEAVKWSCDGSPEFTMEKAEKADRGTDIVLYIDDENKKFLEQNEIDLLLKKYCRFLPVPVISGFEKEWKDGKYVDTDRPNVVNITEPTWSKKPSELTDEDYRNFYHDLYPGQEDPLFWIHLNVDYPFNLTGILFFPKITNNFEITKNGIYGLLGSNGAGKSTTMNIMCGVLNQTEGEVYINGISLREHPVEAKKHIGFLPQKPPLYPDLTVDEYLTHCA